jgi:hypothetical protein
MFNEEKFAIIVLACIITGIALKIIYEKWGRNLPKSAFIGFSLHDIICYYKSAIKIMLKKRWLLWLPLCFVLSNYIFKIPILISARTSLDSSGISLDKGLPICSGFSFLGCLNHISEPLFYKIANAVSRTPAFLDYGYSEAFSASFLFMILFLVCAAIVVFNKPSNKFLSGLRKHNPDNYFFLEKIFKISLAILIFFFVQIIIFEIMKLDTPSTFFFEYPGIFIISLLSMSLLSLVQGLILFTVNGLTAGKILSYKELLKVSLDIAKPLFYLNLILYLVAHISSLLMFPYIFNSVSFINLNLPYFSFAQSKIFIFANTLFAILTYCTTFVLITQGGTLKNAFLFNFKFIANNLFKYAHFIFIASLLIFIPSLLSISVSFFILPLSFFSMFIDIITSIMLILIAVPVFIAFFLFFKDKSSNASKVLKTREKGYI